MPGAGLFPHETVAGDRRLIGDVLLDVDLDGLTTTVAGFENHAGHTLLDSGATPLGRVVAGHGNDGTSGYEGCRVGGAIGTYLHGPLLPRNPVLADWLLGRARPVVLPPGSPSPRSRTAWHAPGARFPGPCCWC